MKFIHPIFWRQTRIYLLFASASFAIATLPGCSATDKAIAAAITPKSNPSTLPSAEAVNGENTRKLYLILVADLREQGKSRAALGYLDAYDKQYPHDPQAALLRGQCLLDTENYAAATAAFRSQLTGGNLAAAQNGLGQVAMAQHNWKDAVDGFTAANAADPSNVGYINNLSYAQLRSGQNDQAVASAREAHELAPDNDRVRNNLVLALTADGKNDEAQSMIAAIADPAQREAVQHMVATQTAAVTPQANS